MQEPKVVWRLQVVRMYAEQAPILREFQVDTWAEVEAFVSKSGRLNTVVVTAVSAPVVFASETSQTAARAAYYGVMSGPCAVDACFGERSGAQE